MVHVHAMHETCEEDGGDGSGHIPIDYDHESPVVMTGIPIDLRGSGGVIIIAATADLSFAGPPLARKKRLTSRDERGWSRQ